MPAIATLEDLKRVDKEIKELKKKYPEACQEIATLMDREAYVGYKNFCKLFRGKGTPEELKGMKEKKA